MRVGACEAPMGVFLIRGRTLRQSVLAEHLVPFVDTHRGSTGIHFVKSELGSMQQRKAVGKTPFEMYKTFAAARRRRSNPELDLTRICRAAKGIRSRNLKWKRAAGQRPVWR